MDKKTLIWALVGIAVIVALAFLFTGRGTPQEQEGVAVEERGTILAVALQDKLFPMQQITITGEGVATTRTEKTFTVRWTEDTTFLLFENSQQVAENLPTPSTENILAANTNAIVSGTLVGPNEIIADTVQILPPAATATPAE